MPDSSTTNKAYLAILFQPILKKKCLFDCFTPTSFLLLCLTVPFLQEFTWRFYLSLLFIFVFESFILTRLHLVILLQSALFFILWQFCLNQFLYLKLSVFILTSFFESFDHLNFELFDFYKTLFLYYIILPLFIIADHTEKKPTQESFSCSVNSNIFFFQRIKNYSKWNAGI